MAQKVQVLLVCDLHDEDDVEGTETIAFGLDGTSYEIDVCDEHSAEVRDAMATVVAHARKAGRAPQVARRGPAKASGGDDRTQQIREWARANGHQVSDRGRLSATLVAAYDAAQ